MQRIFVYLLKGMKAVVRFALTPFDKLFTYGRFYANGVRFSTFKTYGSPKVNVSIGGVFTIDKGLRMNNRASANLIGRFQPCIFNVGTEGRLEIGENVGLSNTAIVCREAITIGNNVKIGGNVVIYDTDFHSLQADKRLEKGIDHEHTATMPVVIEDNVFIGGHSTILKGVTIGKNAIVGACSVVTKNVPADELWAGNPAKLVRTLT